MEVGGEGDYIPITTLSPPDDFCIKVGSDESHFNVSVSVRDKATRQCPQTTTFEVKREPKQIRTEVPLLTALPRGQMGSRGTVGLATGTYNYSEIPASARSSTAP